MHTWRCLELYTSQPITLSYPFQSYRRGTCWKLLSLRLFRHPRLAGNCFSFFFHTAIAVLQATDSLLMQKTYRKRKVDFWSSPLRRSFPLKKAPLCKRAVIPKWQNHRQTSDVFHRERLQQGEASHAQTSSRLPSLSIRVDDGNSFARPQHVAQLSFSRMPSFSASRGTLTPSSFSVLYFAFGSFSLAKKKKKQRNNCPIKHLAFPTSMPEVFLSSKHWDLFSVAD